MNVVDRNKEYCITCNKELHPLRTKHNSGNCNSCYFKNDIRIYLWLYSGRVMFLLVLLLIILLAKN